MLRICDLSCSALHTYRLHIAHIYSYAMHHAYNSTRFDMNAAQHSCQRQSRCATRKEINNNTKISTQKKKNTQHKGYSRIFNAASACLTVARVATAHVRSLLQMQFVITLTSHVFRLFYFIFSLRPSFSSTAARQPIHTAEDSFILLLLCSILSLFIGS